MGSSAARNTSAGCSARRPLPWAICSRQLKPAATMTVSGPAARTAGSNRRSAICIDSA